MINSVGVYSSTFSLQTSKDGTIIRRGHPAYLQLLFNNIHYKLELDNDQMLTLLKQCAEALEE